MQLPRRWERREGERESATGVSEARSHPHRGKTTPTLHVRRREAEARRSRVDDDPPKRTLGRRETSCPPVTPYGAQDSVGHPRRESGESEPGTHEVRAHAVSFGWQKSVGCIACLSHREVARPVGVRRALARKKSVAPPDAGRGWAEGEPVRVCGISKQSSHARPAGHELAGSRYDGRRSWAHARPAFTGRASEGPHEGRETSVSRYSDSQVNSPFSLREDVKAGQHIGRSRIPTRVCLRVTTGTSEVDTAR